MAEGKSNDRRSFVRKLVGLAAVGGASTLLLGTQAPKVSAVGGEISGSGTSGQVAYWTNPSQLAGFQSVLDSAGNNLAFGSGSLATGGGATVGGGASNTAGGFLSTEGGGISNAASDSYS